MLRKKVKYAKKTLKIDKKGNLPIIRALFRYLLGDFE